MWPLTALLLLVPSSGQAATLEKPILSLHPPWTTIFKGERVTLRCDGYHPLLLELRPISTLWYLGHLLLPSHKKSIEVQTPGVYRCQTRGAPVSDPIHLSVSNDWLILQVPYAAVFEGEPLVLRCRGWYDKPVYKLHYYHEGRAVRYFHASANYSVPQARAGDSGRYQCSGTMRIPVESAPMFSAKVAVTVQGGRPLRPGTGQTSPGHFCGGSPAGQGGRRRISPLVHARSRLSSAGKAPLMRSLRGTRVPSLPRSCGSYSGCGGPRAGGGVQAPAGGRGSGRGPWGGRGGRSERTPPPGRGPRTGCPAGWDGKLRARSPLPLGKRSPSSQPRGGGAVRCEPRLHPHRRDTPLQFAFYKYSRPVRRFDWGAEYTVPEPEVDELESYWCEAATATRSVRKRSPWLQLAGRGSALPSASSTAQAPRAAALAPGGQPLSFRKPPVSRSAPSVTSVPNATSPGLQGPAGRAPTAGPPACAPPAPSEPPAGALKPDVDLLLQEMQLLKGLLSRVVLELKEPPAFPEPRATLQTPAPRFAASPGAPETTAEES
nr:Fc receptor-like B [Vulpes vulpes]